MLIHPLKGLHIKVSASLGLLTGTRAGCDVLVAEQAPAAGLLVIRLSKYEGMQKSKSTARSAPPINKPPSI